jgi:diaminopimelate epimerase
MMLSSLNKELQFFKFQGSGNDFIVIEDLEEIFPCQDTCYIQTLCHRQFGIGADGLILIRPSSVADYKMRIFNNDGCEALMCGNGLRCLVAHIIKRAFKQGKQEFYIESLKGIHFCYQEGETIVTGLGLAEVRQLFKVLDEEERVHEIDTGVPHAVRIVDHLEKEDFLKASHKIRWHPVFAPQGVNVTTLYLASKQELWIRTYERGVEGETLACGTGAAAAAIVGHVVYGMQNPIQVKFKSGEKILCYLTENKEKKIEIFLQGKAKYVFDGKVSTNKI